MSVAPRPIWLDAHVDVYVDEISRLGLVVSPEHVAPLIRERVGAVAAEMGVSERTARGYLREDILREMARDLAMTLADEQLGADLLVGPRTVPMPLASIGRTIAALAEAAHIRAFNNDYIGAHGALDVISMRGQIVSTWPSAPSEPVLLPKAALTKGARLLETTATMVEPASPGAGHPP